MREACEWCGDSGELFGYGAFPGGDPRNFEPDEDCSTEEERKAHKEACDAWSRGECPDVKPAHEMHHTPDGGFVHIEWVRFGLGSYSLTPCPACGRAKVEVPHGG